jgi:hypothetical protein
MIEHELNKLNEFIRGWYIDKNICKNIINFFEKNSDLQKKGKTLSGLDLNIKKSTDIYILDNKHEEINTYIKEGLIKCLKEYVNLFPHIDKELGKWGLIEPMNIQKYNPNEGYFQYHCERSNKDNKRVLVFMTYLNDINDEGETEFYYQKLKVKPEQGLTLLWPPEWTHLHRGITSKTETKYIITGWFSFV